MSYEKEMDVHDDIKNMIIADVDPQEIAEYLKRQYTPTDVYHGLCVCGLAAGMWAGREAHSITDVETVNEVYDWYYHEV